MNKFFVKTGFSKLKDSELVMRTDRIIGAISNNDHFPNPSPSILVIESALEDLKSRILRIPSGSRADTIMRDESRVILMDLLKRLGHHVNETAEDLVGLFSSGFEVSSFPYRKNAEIPGIPTGQQLSDSTHSGKMRLDFIPVKGARMYMYRHAATVDGELEWQESLPTTSSKNNIIDGLKPGTEYQVQVKSVNSAGFSDWSDSVRLIAR